jgi:hypothetical protein
MTAWPSRALLRCLALVFEELVQSPASVAFAPQRIDKKLVLKILGE